MKSFLKRLARAVARPLWRLSAPIRRPLARRFDERLTRIVENSIRTHWNHVHVSLDPPDLGSVETLVLEMTASLSMARQIAEHHAEESTLLMDGLVREVARLQLQLESLSELVEELRGGSSLMLVGNEDEQLKVG